MILLALWHKFGTMTQMLSLMETLTNDRSQFRLTEWRKRGICRFPLTKPHVHVGSQAKRHIWSTHALSRKERHLNVGKLGFVCGVWSMVLWSMVLVQGILSDVLTLGILSKVFILSGFRPWYWVRPKTIKGEKIIRQRHSWIEYLMKSKI